MAEDTDPGPDDSEIPTTPIDEAEEAAPAEPSAIEVLAQKVGWKPKDQWKGDTTNWTPADEYLAHAVANTRDLKDQVKGAARMAETAINRERERHRKELNEALDRAVEADDKVAARKATKDLIELEAEAKAPTAEAPTEVADFMARNPWFNSDPDAKALAVTRSEAVARAGGSVKEQLAAAETAVRRAMPELFPDAPKPRTPPLTEGGTRTAAPKKAPTSIANLPPEARKAAESFVRRGMLTEKEALEAYSEA